MKKYFFLFLIVITFFACQKKQDYYCIDGQVSGINEGTIVILLTESEEITDTAWVKDNKFHFEGKTSTEVMAGLKIAENIIKFPLDNDCLHFTINNSDSIDFQVTYENSKIRDNLNNYMNETSANYIEEIRNTPLDKVDSVAMVFLSELEKDYASKKDKSGLAIILSDLIQLIGTKDCPKAIQKLYDLLPDYEKQGYYGQKVSLFLSQANKIYEQDVNFQYIDINGNHNEIEQLRGNYVLIEFWASWCAPCKITIPHLKKLSEIHEQLKIIAVSVDEDLDKWRNEVRTLQIEPWINIHFNQDHVNLKQLFSVVSVPYNILLDPKGNVMGVNYDVNQLKNTLEKEL